MPASSGIPEDAGRITRRDFNRRAVHSAAGALLAASAVPAASAGSDEAPPSGVPEKAAELEAALTLVRAAARHLPESDIAELEDQVRSVLSSGTRLRAYPVPDGQEPDFVFTAALLPEPLP